MQRIAYAEPAKTTGVFTGGRPRVRDLLVVIFSFLLATLVMAPFLASGMSVDKTTAKSNESGGNSVFGGIPTRVTWEGTVGDDEEVSSITLNLPQGSDVSQATVTLTVLDGLDRIDVDATTNFDGDNLLIEFNEPLAAGSLLRVEIYKIALPMVEGEVTIGGTYSTSDGTAHELAESPAITVTASSLTKRITVWLDGQDWVKAWNSVDILRTFLKPQLIVSSIPALFFGWLRALALVLVGFPLAIPFGLCLSLLKMGRFKVPRGLAKFYINVVRGTPLFLQIYIAFFGLPLIGISVNNYVLGVIVLAMNSSAYLAEIFRAGIQSIHKGQFEAAWSLGMTKSQTMFFVIIPQTVRRVIPTMTSEFILLYKDTSLLSSVGVMELMMYSKSLTANNGNITPYIVAALYYLIVTLPLIKVVNILEQKIARSDGSLVSDSVKDRDAQKALKKAQRKSHGNGGSDDGSSSSGDGGTQATAKAPFWTPDADEPMEINPAAHDSM